MARRYVNYQHREHGRRIVAYLWSYPFPAGGGFPVDADRERVVDFATVELFREESRIGC